MSNLTVVPFRDNPGVEHDRAEIIKLLESMLQRVKDGGYQSFAAVLIDTDGCTANCWHNSGMPYALIGALESVKAEYVESRFRGVPGDETDY